MVIGSSGGEAGLVYAPKPRAKNAKSGLMTQRHVRALVLGLSHLPNAKTATPCRRNLK